MVVDDFLPFGPDDLLVNCSNTKDSNEMWGSLLEKAYAKFVYLKF